MVLIKGHKARERGAKTDVSGGSPFVMISGAARRIVGATYAGPLNYTGEDNKSSLAAAAAGVHARTFNFMRVYAREGE